MRIPYKEYLLRQGYREKVVLRLPQIETYKDKFQFNNQSGWVVIQRICFWILNKLKCYAEVEHPQVDTETFCYRGVLIEEKKLSNFILEEMREFLIYHYPKNIDRVVMGRRQFESIVGNIEKEYNVENFYSNCPIDIRFGKEQIMGIDIQVVDSFDSILILPKENKWK